MKKSVSLDKKTTFWDKAQIMQDFRITPYIRDFKQIATATSTTAVVDAVSWGEHVS